MAVKIIMGTSISRGKVVDFFCNVKEVEFARAKKRRLFVSTDFEDHLFV